MATIKDVAKEAKVSIATVSRVINQSPKASKTAIKSVKAAMKKLGYRPNANARALVSQSTNTVGVLVGDVSDPFFGAMIKSIDTVARQHNKHLLIGNGYHNASSEREALELLINSRCDSLIVHSKGLSNQELIEFAKELPSLMLINRYIPEIAARCIALNNYQGAYLATEYLINQGHQHIGYLCSDHHIEDVTERRAGYLDALTAYGLKPNQQDISYGSPDQLGGEQAMNQLLKHQTSITAIAAYNDYMAAGAMSAINDKGMLIPQDISVIGFDDGLVANYLRPKLTTIAYPIKEMAKQAINHSLTLTKKEITEVEPLPIFEPQLIIRHSVTQRKIDNSSGVDKSH